MKKKNCRPDLEDVEKSFRIFADLVPEGGRIIANRDDANTMRTLEGESRPVTTFDDRLATLLDDMHETMIAADGVGLAGPQVGMMRRLFVVWDTTDAPEEIPEDYEYKFIDFVNPEILAVSEEEETAYEGCLSFPGHNGAVTRPVAVKVRAQDRNGEWFELEADGLLGRCIQHENDHLDGITIMESSEYFYEDTEEGKKAAREAKGNN